jgi:haloalkane dehalogenase
VERADIHGRRMKDPVLGPTVMAALRQQIRGCPSPLEILDGGHFVQEWGKEIAEAAVTAFA